ncbi:MAG: cytochrome c biogenesis protein CcdA [Chloroflexota bacterium]|nr:cytochrome c biogenesis protein CcdA [Chloroflexota bacterium]
MWAELVTGFTLGAGAILTNACMLPLYPGLIAFMAAKADDERTRRASGWLGVLVLAGVLSMMLVIGLVLHLLQASFGGLLTTLLPIIYIIVIVFGVLMLFGRNPFARLSQVQSPVVRNPYLTAYLYGVLFAPMTLPCTGPVVTAAFLRGAAGADALAGELLFFLAFGLGFGFPLVLLPLIALPLQRRFVGWLAQNHVLLTRISGVLLIAIGIFGFVTEILPNRGTV